MIAVAGLWELGHNVPISEAPLWSLPLRDFAVDEWHMYPVTGINNSRITEWDDIEKMITSLRSRLNMVFVSEQAEQELHGFIHPKDACYVFGRANYSPFLSLMKPMDNSVRIKTVKDSGLLWPHQALVTVLWHRGGVWQ